jgi:signal transduction histidine kinase
MYRRIVILSVIILAALAGLVRVGYRSLQIQAEGMAGKRLGEFAAVAEQIRQDVKRNLDEFMQREHNRPYTHYQNLFVPEDAPTNQQQMPVQRSPLGGRLEHDLAYGNFQIEPDGEIITPNDDLEQLQEMSSENEDLKAKIQSNRANIKNNLWPALRGRIPGSFTIDFLSDARNRPDSLEQPGATPDPNLLSKAEKDKKSLKQIGQNYLIRSLQNQDSTAQVITQRRSVLEQNRISNSSVGPQQQARADNQAAQLDRQVQPPSPSQAETVQVRIEPFVPLVVPDPNPVKSIFGGQVFLLRQVRIEDRQFLQGFRLNEKKLIEEVKESAKKFMRKGMTFELAKPGDDYFDIEVAYPAVLDFGFGQLKLNLREIDPYWIGREIRRLRYWYYSIIAVVLLAVMLGLASLWRNAGVQARLAQKKDDFISAVSHELRTPLTSIRMYSEMLEKNWVKSPEKIAEYYGNMRQESERLSRLIENVLDFSRIQRGRRQYAFEAGDMNKCVADVVEMMRPYAAQKGFSIETELGRLDRSSFDSDAVTQIVVNLLDNAIKYARDAEDKTIIVRTTSDDGFTLIEVQDRGPGVPNRQRKKIFEQFYRSEAEATRETNGTGLGLTLVKKFAEAHNGFVEIANAKPTGAIFTVALANHL